MIIPLTDGIVTVNLHHIIWTNRSQDRARGSERATFGRLVVQRLAGPTNQDIILEAKVDGNRLSGWFLWSQVAQLAAWRDDGSILTLTYDTETRSVMIPLGGLSIEPLRQYSKTPAGDEICAGTLTLKEV